MKRKTIIPLAISALLLSACGNHNGNVSFFAGEAELYRLSPSAIDAEGIVDLSKQEKGMLPLLFVESEPLIPYVRIGDAFRLVEEELEKKIVSETNSTDLYSITIAQGDKQFHLDCDLKNKEFRIQGALDEVLSGTEDDSSNRVDGVVTRKVVSGNANTPYTLSFQNTSIRGYYHQNAVFVPLSLIFSIIIKGAGTGLYFDQSRAYAFGESSTLASVRLKNSPTDEPFTIQEEMAAALKEKGITSMPEYMRKFNRDCLTFVFQNYYGLSHSMKIKSMPDYLASFSTYDELLSEDPTVRGEALHTIFQRFQDDHTALLGSALAWGEDSGEGIPQSLHATRGTIESALKAQRKAIYAAEGLKPTDIRYSKDGKTAVVPLTKFASYPSAVNLKTKQRTATMEQILKQDTYFQTKKALEEIKAKGGVERIIIDMSVNDGGDSGTMGNLLALISPNNESTMHFHQMLNNSITAVTTRLDMNEDGKIDEADQTYGNDFLFYILTSPAAFSCGTAYPFYAQAASTATIIGVNPAGGECALSQDVLPNGQPYAHSGSMRVCHYADNKVEYDEEGVIIEKGFTYDQFYNLEAMASALSEMEGA